VVDKAPNTRLVRVHVGSSESRRNWLAVHDDRLRRERAACASRAFMEATEREQLLGGMSLSHLMADLDAQCPPALSPELPTPGDTAWLCGWSCASPSRSRASVPSCEIMDVA
jgi:hypothetical protein